MRRAYTFSGRSGMDGPPAPAGRWMRTSVTSFVSPAGRRPTKLESTQPSWYCQRSTSCAVRSLDLDRGGDLGGAGLAGDRVAGDLGAGARCRCRSRSVSSFDHRVGGLLPHDPLRRGLLASCGRAVADRSSRRPRAGSPAARRWRTRRSRRPAGRRSGSGPGRRRSGRRSGRPRRSGRRDPRPRRWPRPQGRSRSARRTRSGGTPRTACRRPSVRPIFAAPTLFESASTSAAVIGP